MYISLHVPLQVNFREPSGRLLRARYIFSNDSTADLGLKLSVSVDNWANSRLQYQLIRGSDSGV